jgi:hypothetical protein
MSEQMPDPIREAMRVLAREFARKIDAEILQPLDAVVADRLIRESGAVPPKVKP